MIRILELTYKYYVTFSVIEHCVIVFALICNIPLYM
jgi:hypothetical protein